MSSLTQLFKLKHDDEGVEKDQGLPGMFSVHLVEKIWILVNFIREKTVSTFVLVKILASRSIYSAEGGQDEQNNTFTFAIFKKNWFYWPLVLVDVLLPRGWSPPPLPAGWSTSAPPCVTLVVVRMTLA